MKNNTYLLSMLLLASCALLAGCAAKPVTNPEPAPALSSQAEAIPAKTVTATSHKLMGKCPISSAWVRDNEVQGKLSYKGTIYYFCTENCKGIFKEVHPDAKEVK